MTTAIATSTTPTTYTLTENDYVRLTKMVSRLSALYAVAQAEDTPKIIVSGLEDVLTVVHNIVGSATVQQEAKGIEGEGTVSAEPEVIEGVSTLARILQEIFAQHHDAVLAGIEEDDNWPTFYAQELVKRVPLLQPIRGFVLPGNPLTLSDM